MQDLYESTTTTDATTTIKELQSAATAYIRLAAAHGEDMEEAMRGARSLRRAARTNLAGNLAISSGWDGTTRRSEDVEKKTQSTEEARARRNGRVGACAMAPLVAARDDEERGGQMDEGEIRAMLVAARQEAWAAARARRAPKASAAAVAATERRAMQTARERAARQLQSAWRRQQARGEATRRRKRWRLAVGRAERELGHQVLVQWRLACTRAIARRAATQQSKAARKARRRAAISLQARWRGAMGRQEATGRWQRRLALATEEGRRQACVRVQAAARRRAGVTMAATRRVAAAERLAEEQRAKELRICALAERADEPMWLQDAEARLQLGGGAGHEAAAWWTEAARWMERVEARLVPVKAPLAELPWPRRSGGRQRRMARSRRRGDCWAIDYEMAVQRAEARAEQRFRRVAEARNIVVSK